MMGSIANLKGVTSAEIKAIEQILNGLVTLIGETENTGGNIMSGTVMAKLNKVIQNEIDINTLIGSATNIGGSVSAGTIMAKLNKILTDWTTTRAEKMDTINTNATNLNTRLTNERAEYLDLLNRGVGIKSVQRGSFLVEIEKGIPKQEEYIVTLSTIVPSKTFFLFDGKMISYNTGTVTEGGILKVSTTSFTYIAGFSAGASGFFSVKWQAIEFY